MTLKMPKAAKRPLDESSTTDVISLTVKSQDGRQLYFKINRHVPFQKLFTTYCEKMNVDYRSIQFVFNGARITAKRTPQQLGIEDGDEIDAMTHQMGGGGCCCCWWVVIYSY